MKDRVDFPNWTKLVDDVKRSRAEKNPTDKQRLHTGMNKQREAERRRTYYGKRV